MAELSFGVKDWIGAGTSTDASEVTMASLRLAVSGVGGGRELVLSHVEDTIAKGTRDEIRVPAVELAQWLLVNWWRLRWESKPERPGTGWRSAHQLGCIGGGTAWPGLEITSDGEYVRLEMDAEPRPDVAAIRYLTSVSVEVPGAVFESAVDRFVDTVEARLGERLPGYRELIELRGELSEERRQGSQAMACRLQALAGIDPGAVDDDWIEAARTLSSDVGCRSTEELMSVLPDLGGRLEAARTILDAMKASSAAVDLTWVGAPSPAVPGELPWERGARLARELRRRKHLGSGPLADKTLSELLNTPFPLPGSARREALTGGVRNGVAGGRTRIVWRSARPESQRFYLARLIGAAHVLGDDEHLVPVTNAATALQKVERSFAQELLCPWEALDAFTSEQGTDDEALVDAAHHFHVSEYVVRSTLVNRGKLTRDRLPDG